MSTPSNTLEQHDRDDAERRETLIALWDMDLGQLVAK
jgi:hypothetical protein